MVYEVVFYGYGSCVRVACTIRCCTLHLAWRCGCEGWGASSMLQSLEACSRPVPSSLYGMSSVSMYKQHFAPVSARSLRACPKVLG